MQRLARIALSGAAVLVLAGGLLAVGAAAGSPPETSSDRPAAERVDDITRLQADLVRVPEDYSAWAQLGDAYLRESRTTADPTYYAKAEGAYQKALALRPDDAGPVTGLAALAAARHDFAGALALTDRALALNDFAATTYAVRADALNELGRYDESFAAVRRMADLQPGVATSTRASYAFELRGDVEKARLALEEAVQLATDPADIAFAQYYLGELAWNEGDVPAARAAYEAGLAAMPADGRLRAGLAKVLAGEGSMDLALDELEDVVDGLPAPDLLVQYGELLEAAGREEDAQEQYDVVRATQQLFAANGQDVDTELAVFEADHGDPQEAVAVAEKAYAKRPMSVFTQDAYAWALHKAGRTREALPIARQALRMGLRSPALLAHLGTIEAAAGERAAARATLERTSTLNPDFSPLHGPRAQELLASLP